MNEKNLLKNTHKIPDSLKNLLKGKRLSNLLLLHAMLEAYAILVTPLYGNRETRLHIYIYIYIYIYILHIYVIYIFSIKPGDVHLGT